MNESDEFKNKKALVIGFGKSGKAAVEALLKYDATVTVYDGKTETELDSVTLDYIKQNKIEGFWGELPGNFSVFDMAVVSPGIPLSADICKGAQDAGVEIIGELELAYRICPGKFAAITGTNGKTTTTTLTGKIFENSGRDSALVGNIGFPVAHDALKAGSNTWMITEVSSFQLETTKTFRPGISAILNLTPDHLDRHGSMDNYRDCKGKIFENQCEKDFCILNKDDKSFEYYSSECKCKVLPFSRKEELKEGAYLKDGVLVYRGEDGKTVEFCRADELKIPGEHNIENALAAVLIATAAGIDKEVIIETLLAFESVENRMENCGTVNGIRFINDSKGTNPDASIKAVLAMKKNILLLAGGYDKHVPFDAFIEACKGRVKHMFLIGASAVPISQTADRMQFDRYSFKEDLRQCVDAAYEMAEPGDVIMLSPACASWGMYPNYMVRGDDFRNCVQRLRDYDND